MEEITNKDLVKKIEELEQRLEGVEKALNRALKVTEPRQRIGGDKGYYSQNT